MVCFMFLKMRMSEDYFAQRWIRAFLSHESQMCSIHDYTTWFTKPDEPHLYIYTQYSVTMKNKIYSIFSQTGKQNSLSGNHCYLFDYQIQ